MHKYVIPFTMTGKIELRTLFDRGDLVRYLQTLKEDAFADIAGEHLVEDGTAKVVVDFDRMEEIP
jgi:hypothetical protein